MQETNLRVNYLKFGRGRGPTKGGERLNKDLSRLNSVNLSSGHEERRRRRFEAGTVGGEGWVIRVGNCSVGWTRRAYIM